LVWYLHIFRICTIHTPASLHRHYIYIIKTSTRHIKHTLNASHLYSPRIQPLSPCTHKSGIEHETVHDWTMTAYQSLSIWFTWEETPPPTIPHASLQDFKEWPLSGTRRLHRVILGFSIWLISKDTPHPIFFKSTWVELLRCHTPHSRMNIFFTSPIYILVYYNLIRQMYI